MDVEVRTEAPHVARLADQEPAVPGPGQAVLAIDSFGLSTNNVTFAVTGDLLGYWKLFPASAPGWGRVPVFGFADVAASNHPGLAEGTRVFGYLPMSDDLLVEPERCNERGFVDGSAHRRDVMAPVWNHYQRVDEGPPRGDAIRSLLRPLFVTGFLIEDFIEDHGGFGAGTVILTSASAKTAIATAHELRERGTRRVVGLTSPAHVPFVESLGVYDDVAVYEAAGSIEGDGAVLVDIAGRLDARDAVHQRFGSGLGHSMTVGLSNVPEASRLLAPPPASGPAPEVFYAQLQVSKRAGDWGAEVFESRLEAAWERFVRFTDTWLAIDQVRGPDAVLGAWQALLAGEGSPSRGLQLTLHA